MNNVVCLWTYSIQKIESEKHKPEWGFSSKALRALRFIRSYANN